MVTMTLLIWIILLPLVGSLIIGLSGTALKKTGVSVIACGVVAAAFVMSLLVFLEVLAAYRADAVSSFTQPLFEWFRTDRFEINLSLMVDPLSSVMLLIITGVGGLIHLYSTAYMKHDEGFGRYFAYLNLFIFFMLLLVLGSNYLVLFIGWEGVGLCSYLLIGFWYSKTDYSLAAKKAFVMNRIGDLGFLIALFALLGTFGSLEFSKVLTDGSAMQVGDPAIVLITFLLFIAATGKSAQIPLFTWLPDAMAGPTPVSALIHAATMVTAGIYLIARSSVLFVLSPVTMEWIAVIGLATALVAAFIALRQNDIKKVLAYSTVSQLGYMFLALGLGAFGAAFFHVITHAFFKALLFLGAGSVIHAMSNQQDMRSMGGLKKALPVTYRTMLIGTIAISGIPPLSGFFSKDQILAAAFAEQPVFWILGVFGAVMTAFYMFRMLYLTFFGSFRGSISEREHLHESPPLMTIPLIILAVLSVVAGVINVPVLFGGSEMLGHFLSPSLRSGGNMTVSSLSHSTEYLLMGVSVVAVLLVVGFAYRRYVKAGTVPGESGEESHFLKRLSSNRLYIDEVYNRLIVRPLFRLSEFLYQWFDRKGIDGIVNGLGGSFMESGKLLRLVQNGHAGFYLFLMVVGIVCLLGYTLFYLS